MNEFLSGFIVGFLICLFLAIAHYQRYKDVPIQTQSIDEQIFLVSGELLTQIELMREKVNTLYKRVSPKE